MSSASSAPTARTIQRCTVAVWRSTNSPKAASSPRRAAATSSASVFSGRVKDESRRARGAGVILRRNGGASATAVGIGGVLVLEPARLFAGRKAADRAEDPQPHQLRPELVADGDTSRRGRLLLERHPGHREGGAVARARC